MISIIICSAKAAVIQNALDSISSTIGVEYETIIIENGKGDFGISEAYNQGVAKAKFDIFCFMHEDISFETIGWGYNVCKHLQDKSVGLIGVAGGDTKSLVPSSWSSSVFESEISIIQHFKSNSEPPKRIIKTGYPENNSSIKAVTCIDGVWMCTRRDVYNKCQFDSNNFPQFHGYDIDFSLQVSMTLKVCVVFDVLLHHYSDGTYNKAWMSAMIRVSNKWQIELPKSVRQLSKQDFKVQHWTTIGRFVDYLITLNYSLPQILNYLCKYSFNQYFSVKYFLYFLKYIFQNYFQVKASHPAKELAA